MAPGDEMPTLLVAAEDRAGFEAVTTLTDRLVEEEVEWTRGILEAVRIWAPWRADQPWRSITHVRRDTQGIRRRARGHFDGEPGAPDAANTRRLLLEIMARRDEISISALVIARDLDRRPERVRGMRQAIESGRWPFPVVLAWAEPEAESWYIAGFVAEDEGEAARLGELVRDLGFDPTRAPHDLTSTAKGSVKDAKAALDHLCAGDDNRRRRCLHVPLGHLIERGHGAGIADFLADVRAHILPLFGHDPRR